MEPEDTSEGKEPNEYSFQTSNQINENENQNPFQSLRNDDREFVHTTFNEMDLENSDYSFALRRKQTLSSCHSDTLSKSSSTSTYNSLKKKVNSFFNMESHRFKRAWDRCPATVFKSERIFEPNRREILSTVEQKDNHYKLNRVSNKPKDEIGTLNSDDLSHLLGGGHFPRKRTKTFSHEKFDKILPFQNHYYYINGYFEVKAKTEGFLPSTRIRSSLNVDLCNYIDYLMSKVYRIKPAYIPTENTAQRPIYYTSEDIFTNSEKVLWFLTTSPSGIWSRSALIKSGLRKGSMLPFIDQAQELGYAIIIGNPISACWSICSQENPNPIASSTQQETALSDGIDTPLKYILWIYDNVVSKCKAQSFYVVGSRTTKQMCKHVLLKDLAERNKRRRNHYLRSTIPPQLNGIFTFNLSTPVYEKDDSLDVLNFSYNNWINFTENEYSIKKINVSKTFFGGYNKTSEEEEAPNMQKLCIGANIMFSNKINHNSLGFSQLSNDTSTVYEKSYLILKVIEDLHKNILTTDTSIGVFSENATNIIDILPGDEKINKNVFLYGVECNIYKEDINHPEMVTKNKVSSTTCSSVASLKTSTTEETDSWKTFLESKNPLNISMFRLETVIGKGAFGLVLMVRLKNDETRKCYAMKIIEKSIVTKPTQIRNTLLEQQIMSNLDSPFLLSLIFSFQTSTKLYLITDYCSSGNLLIHLRRNEFFSEASTMFMIAEVLEAISYLHEQNILYRDLKPENILLSSKGHLLLTDFGLCKILLNGEKTYTLCGTAEYIAPEQLNKEKGYDFAVDIWTMGILMYELLHGRTPFYSRNRKEGFSNILNNEVKIHCELSDASEALLRLFLCKDPLNRKPLTNGNKTSTALFKLCDAFKFHRLDFTNLLNTETIPEFRHLENLRPSDLNQVPKSVRTMEVIHSPLLKETKSCINSEFRFSNYTFYGDADDMQKIANLQQRGPLDEETIHNTENNTSGESSRSPSVDSMILEVNNTSERTKQKQNSESAQQYKQI